jgi:mannose-6-phosphate isomerase-like protein (cupin superfamily)
MKRTLYFDGRLSKSSLPVFEGAPPAGAGASGPKRLRLAQGELANFYDDPEGVRYLAFLELRPDGVRGNHVHRVKKEHFYLIAGEVVCVAKPAEGGELVELELKAGDMVTIHPGIAHAFKPLSIGQAIEFSSGMFDAGDIERIALI